MSRSPAPHAPLPSLPSLPLLMGLDVGSTNIKAVVYRRDGSAVVVASVAQETHFPQPGWAYYDPHRLWELCCNAIRTAVAQLPNPRQIVSIAVSSFGEAGVLLDANGKPATDMIAWFDRRSLDQCQRFNARIDPDEQFAIAGTVVQQIMSAPKLIWHREHEPEAWARSVRFLNAADFIAYQLSGEGAQSLSLASRTGLLDLRARDWSDRLLELAGLDLSLLAPTAEGGTPLGHVTKVASRLTGLPTSALVAVGGHDHVCGALAAGAMRRGDILDSIGTSECLFVALDWPLDNREMGRRGYTQGAHARDGFYIYGGLYAAGICFDWFSEVAAAGIGHDELLLQAAAVVPGSLGAVFLPHLRMSSTPQMDAEARAAFVGLTTDHSLPALARAVLEGIAFEGRATVEPLLQYAGLPPLADIAIIGGTTRNQLLLEIKASVMNARLHVLESEEASALGAAMLGGIAAGIYQSVEDAVGSVCRSARVVDPHPEAVSLYDTVFNDVYRHLYASLVPASHRLSELFVDQGTGDK